jgi:hypothetical protein
MAAIPLQCKPETLLALSEVRQAPRGEAGGETKGRETQGREKREEDMRRTAKQVIEGKVDIVPFEGVFIEDDIPGIGHNQQSMFEHLQGKRVRVTIEDLTPLVEDEVAENSGVSGTDFGIETTLHDQVIDFHKQFCPDQGTGKCPPRIPAVDVIRLRWKLITEEFFEGLASILPFSLDPFSHTNFVGQQHTVNQLTLARATIDNAILRWGGMAVDLVEMVDALADLDYVVEGGRTQEARMETVRCPFHFVDTEMKLLTFLDEKNIDEKTWRAVSTASLALISPEGRLARNEVHYCEECGFVANIVKRRPDEQL